MQDLVFLALIVGFFAIAVVVVGLCDRVVKGTDDPVRVDERVS